MKIIKVKSSVFAVFAVLLSMPLLAQSFGANPVSDTSPSAMPQHIPSVVYKNAATANQLAGTISVDQTAGFGEGQNTSLRVRFFRANGLSMENSRSNMFIKDDHASFTVNAPTPLVNGALSFVGTVYQTPVDSSVTKVLQVLSLVATRRINAEFSYSAKVNKYSSFDSVIAYRLHPATDSGKSDVVASVRYGIKF